MAGVSKSPSTFKGPLGPLRRRCSQCLVTDRPLLRCSACNVVYYCSRDHQVAHRPQHQSSCTQIRKARAKLAEEDYLLRHATKDLFTPANAFETDVGNFWCILGTRDYMRARFALVRMHLIPVNTFDAIHEALGHMQDMLRLSRSDNLGVRDMVPGLMLRLDLDQECYDFVKWWVTCDPDSHRNSGDMTLAHLNIHGADVLEDPGFLLGNFTELEYRVAILILKLKLLVDIRNLKITRKILARRRLPVKLWAPIELAVVRSPLSIELQKSSLKSIIEIETKLMTHARQLGAAVVEANENFIFHLFDPDEALSATPESYSAGSWEEMALTMQHSYPTWWETEGVLDLLNDARACAARESEEEIRGMMQGSTFNSGAGSHRTAEELLEDVSVNRVWGYLDDAIENAAYLGPWSERPSERRMREIGESNARARAEDAELDDLYSTDSECSDDEFLF